MWMKSTYYTCGHVVDIIVHLGANDICLFQSEVTKIYKTVKAMSAFWPLPHVALRCCLYQAVVNELKDVCQMFKKSLV